MSAVNIKSKASRSSTSDNAIVRKFEAMSSNFKSTPTIIARDLEIEGELSGSGIMEIEGSIKGTIRGNSVILREEGRVQGTIIAESLDIRGTFEGNIKATNISISSKANISGTIEYGSLSVEDGACIDGQFKRLAGE